MRELLEQILRECYSLIRREVPRLIPSFQWATVTSVVPLRIRFDGATTPITATPDRTVSGLMIGDRVDVRHRTGGVPIITGVAGGGGTGVRSFPTRAAAGAQPNGTIIYSTADNAFYGRANGNWVAL